MPDAVPELRSLIRDVPDFPKKGIMFKDITPLIGHGPAFAGAVKKLAEPFRNRDIQAVVGVEARGFIVAPAVALELGVGFVPVRKPGKLPYKTRKIEYSLEYGTDSIEAHLDAVAPGQRVLMVDDLLATGGTMAAACKLVESLGGKVCGCAFLVELAFLPGRKALAGREPIVSLIRYEGE